MAFVPPTTSRPFLGRAVQPSKCAAAPKRLAAAAPARMAFSSIDDPSTATELIDLTIETKTAVINAAYKQVFGNAYLMDSERAELAIAESDFRQNSIDVRELVRSMGKSDAYRKRFFARSGPYRFVELNYKHFLGRGPASLAEINYHTNLLLTEGFEAEIDSYVDSAEYNEMFGQDIVPRFVFKGMYPTNDDFNRMTIMRKHWDGCSTSTVSGSTAPGKPIPPQLLVGHGGYVNGFVGVMKGLPAGFRPEPAVPKASPLPANAQAPLRVRIKVAENLYQVFEVPAQKPRFDPQWKKDLSGGKKWNGVWY